MAEDTNQDFARALGQAVERQFELERGAIKVDEETRTVEIAFSSEFPVQRYFGLEILDHTPKAADLKRLNTGGAVLLCHDRNQQVGGVVKKSARIDDDRVGRCVVRFSRSQLGTDTMQDVADEIRTTVSLRYIPLEMVLEKSDKKTGDVYRVTKWEVLEVSFEPIPADPTVGVGRNQPELPQTESNAGAERATQPPTEVRTAMENEQNLTQPSAEVLRAREVVEMGEVLGDPELAREIATNGEGVAEFRIALAAKRKAAQEANKPQTEDPAAAANRNGGLELARSNSRVTLKSFKGERAHETAFRMGHFLNAVLFNSDQSRAFCREHGIKTSRQRAHSESDNESGGFLVPDEFENVMIDLRLDYGVFRRNANVVPVGGAKKNRPRRKGGLTAYPIGARGDNRRLTESKKGWDLVSLDPKKWGVLAKYEDELSEDSVIALADDLASEIAYALTQAEDECGFLGDGTSTYHGIVGVINKLLALHATPAYIAGLQQASGNQWSEIVLADILGMVGRLPSFARRTGQVKWYCTNEFWATVLCRISLLLGGSAVAQIQNEIAPVFLGKPVEIVEVMPHTEANSQIPLLYGNLAQAAMFGDRRGMTVKMTDSNDTDFEEDLMAIKGTERFDINVHDVGNASATANQRKAGPIVGLQMQSS